MYDFLRIFVLMVYFQENCIRDADKETVLKLFNIMYKVHYETLMNGPCNGKKQEPVLFSDDDVINMIVEHDKTMVSNFGIKK